ncbi:MAG: glycosyltransferase [Syntrophobacteraceae bacterium]
MTITQHHAPSCEKPVHLAILVSTLAVGGAEQLLLELLRHIDSTRIQPSVYFLREPGMIGGEAMRLGYCRADHLIRARFDPFGILRLSRLLKASQTDVLLMINHRDALLYGVLAAKLSRVPTIINWVNETNRTYSHHRMTMMLRRVLHLGVTRVVAAARGHRDYLARTEKIPSKKLVTIYNGVDAARFASQLTREQARQRLGLDPTVPVISIIAALRPDKAHHIFLRAAAMVLQSVPDAHFLVVGDGPERGRLMGLAQELGIHGRVHFLGARRDVGDLLAAVDVSTLSSNPEQETLSVAALEAMSAGVPMVTTDVGFMREIVIPGITGLLALPGNARDLADKLILLVRDDRTRMGLGEASKRLVRSGLTIEAMVSGFQRLFLRP